MDAVIDPGSQETLHIVVTCSNRKTQPIPDRLHLRSVPHDDVGERAHEWIRRIGADRSPLIMARDLYAGEHWMISRGLVDEALRSPTQLWTCSAGYGLIRADAFIHPYAATFTGGHPDSVSWQADGANEWWQALSTWEGPTPGQPRSIRALAEADPAAAFLLVLSAPYLHACREDILAASKSVRDADRFMVVSAGARNAGPLGALLLPGDARLQACLGGTRQALNARIAAYVTSTKIRSRAEASRQLAHLLAQQPPITRYDRKKLTDTEVLELIKEGVSELPGTTASRLLRQIRDAGYACEQGRFGRLFQVFRENAT
jgi:hypothetical protein